MLDFKLILYLLRPIISGDAFRRNSLFLIIDDAPLFSIPAG